MQRPVAAFPEAFRFGASTAAFQIEGANRADGRGESIWDRFCATPGAIAGGGDGSVACDHYHRWPEDLDLVRGLGLDAYRFSVSWVRVQPAGRGPAHAAGLDFYDRLVDGMLERGLAPFATLYHWDLPQPLQDAGGWTVRETADRFVDYAGLVAARLGDRLAALATFNEPFITAELGHRLGLHAPGLRDDRAALAAAHHQLLAHGRAVRALRAAGCGTPLGIVNVHGPVHAGSPAVEDQAAVERDDLAFNRLYTEALFGGAYPARTEALLGHAPPVRDGDLAEIATPLDWYGINYYFRRLAFADESRARLPAGAQLTAMGWEVSHDGLAEFLVDLHRRHPNLPPVYVTEFGCACDDRVVLGRVDDHERVAYLQGQFAAMGRALAAGVDLRGAFVWSLLDNFEWALGYAKRFGLVHVDFRTQRRTPKASAAWLRAFIAAQRGD